MVTERQWDHVEQHQKNSKNDHVTSKLMGDRAKRKWCSASIAHERVNYPPSAIFSSQVSSSW